MKTKSYSKLITLPTFEERFAYLQTDSIIGIETFGHNRYLNQLFYTGKDWLRTRDKALTRDLGLDLGVEGWEIAGTIYVHHINPITVEMVINNDPQLYDLENLICCSFNTHNAIHYGSIDSVIKPFVERQPGDTSPWRK